MTYQFWQALTLGFSPLYVALNFSQENAVPFARTEVGIEQIAHGHAILIAGSLALYIGMKHLRPKNAAATLRIVRHVSGWELLISFTAGALIQIFIPEITAIMGSAFTILSNMAIAALALFAVEPPGTFWRSAGAYWCILLGGTATLLMLYAHDDSKMMLSFSFVPLALAIHRHLGVVPLITFGMAFLVLYLALIAPLVSTFRNTVRANEQGERRLSQSSATVLVLERLYTDFQDGEKTYISSWVDSTMMRLSDSVPAGWIADSVATSGLLYGAGMEYVPVAVVPRILWRDKPVIERGRYFTVALGMASNEEASGTSTGQTSSGELYWNFGWPGVILGMYFLGLAIAFWWRTDGGNPINGVFEMTAFIGATLSFVLGTGSAAGSNFIAAITSAIILGGAIRVRDLIFRRREKFVRVREFGTSCI